MKESVFGEKETENLNAEYGKPPVQPERVEQAVLYDRLSSQVQHNQRKNF